MLGQANTFLNYAHEYETYQFGGDVKKCIVTKTQSFEQASENARKALVSSIRYGKQMVWNFETMVPEM